MLLPGAVVRPVGPGAVEDLVQSAHEVAGGQRQTVVLLGDLRPVSEALGVEGPADEPGVGAEGGDTPQCSWHRRPFEESAEPGGAGRRQPRAAIDGPNGGGEAVMNGGELRHGKWPSVAEGGGATDDIGSPNYVFIYETHT